MEELDYVQKEADYKAADLALQQAMDIRRYSMIGDGLSHVSFGALSIALAMGWSPLKISIPVVVLAAFFLLRITENSRIKSDAAIALISAP